MQNWLFGRERIFLCILFFQYFTAWLLHLVAPYAKPEKRIQFYDRSQKKKVGGGGGGGAFSYENYIFSISSS